MTGVDQSSMSMADALRLACRYHWSVQNRQMDPAAARAAAWTAYGYTPDEVALLEQACHPAAPPFTPTQGRRGQHATADVQPTTTATSQPLTPTALTQADPPTLTTCSTQGSGTPGGRKADSGKAASSTTDPDQPHDPAA